jgi:CheY-like chemotaxis protein/HPt (histidine-containing phosphotransfer) domain-containing protein
MMSERPKLDALRVLAVDDHPVNRAFLRAVLKPHVRSLELVDSGQAAIDCCRADRFDLLVLDLHMPDLDGFSAWHRIREIHAAPLPTVVALSADHREEALELAREAGFRGYIGKPAAPEDLLAALKRIVEGEAVFEAMGTSRQPLPNLLDDEAAARALGSGTRVAAMREAFAEELRAGLPELEHDLLNGDEAVGERLHQWVGAAGYVGTPRLARAAERLRDAVKTQHPAQWGGAYLDFRRGADAALELLERPEGVDR